VPDLPINLTTVTYRPLHAVLLPPEAASERLLEALAGALDGTGPAILPLDPTLPRARLDELLTAFAPASIETAEDLRRAVLPHLGGRASPGVPDDVAVVLATSGSTGTPKGAELSADALLASARASLSRLRARPGDRWLCGLPTHHISGLGVLVRSLAAGVTPVVRSRLDADTVDRAVGRCGYLSLVPTQLRRLLDSGAPLAGFKAILLGGAAIPPGMLDEAAAAGVRVVTSYGMTETCGGCVYDGVPLDGVRVAAGADGRIRVSGPVLFSGYRLAPELTGAALDEGWFVTSDLGGIGADGRLRVRGRADDVINSGGEKIVASEVEHALRGCAGVRDAVVVGTPDPHWGQRVTALVIPADPSDPPSLARIREHVRASLPRYAAPQALLVVAEIPMLASGKPDRQRLRQIAGSAGSVPA
jgi:O-succinylbenzoic acid--CoA ligase